MTETRSASPRATPNAPAARAAAGTAISQPAVRHASTLTATPITMAATTALARFLPARSAAMSSLAATFVQWRAPSKPNRLVPLAG